MVRPLSSTLAVLAVLTLVTGCTGPALPAEDSATAPTTPSPQPEETAAPVPGADADRPRLHFTAHGVGLPNTVGPACARGIETSESNLMRVTAPEGWLLRGSGGGSGPSQLSYDVGGGSVTVHLVGRAEQLASHFDGHEFGGEAGTAELDGTGFPVVEARLSDDEAGFALTSVPWLTNLPGGSEYVLTVFVTSEQTGVPSAGDAIELLSSVRVERCQGIMESVIALSARSVLAVPEIVNDPLGKTVPSSPQPPYDPLAGPDAWAVEQLAYLLPFPEPTDRCVAEVLQDDAARAGLPPVLLIGPLVVGASGTNLDALEGVAAGC